MANPKNENSPETIGTVPAVAVPALSVSDMMALLTTAIAQSNASQQENLLKGLAELRKPYENPGEKALEEQMRQSRRAFLAKQDAGEKAFQDSCPHLQGSSELSQRMGDLTSIVKHRLDNGEVIGICTNCIRVFRQLDDDYSKEMRRKSGNQMSQAGQRFATVMG